MPPGDHQVKPLLAARVLIQVHPAVASDTDSYASGYDIWIILRRVELRHSRRRKGTERKNGGVSGTVTQANRKWLEPYAYSTSGYNERSADGPYHL